MAGKRNTQMRAARERRMRLLDDEAWNAKRIYPVRNF
jgi:hypothetical protein